MAVLINCGFVREIIISGTSTYKSCVFDRIYDDFVNRFGDLPNFVKTKSPLKVKFREFSSFIQKKKVPGDKKQQLRRDFSEEKWGELTWEQKEVHTLKDCQDQVSKKNNNFSSFLLNYIYILIKLGQAKLIPMIVAI